MKFTLSEALASGHPALLDAAQWPPAAARRWTPDRLAELFPTLDPVRRGAPSGIFWNADAALADANLQHAATGFAYAGKTHEESRVPTATFFDAADPQYFSGSLLDANGEPHPDLQPVTPLVEALSNGTVGATMTLKAWFGTAGAVTPLHYDTQHNVFAQLHGTKAFWLLPPRTTRRSVRLYPRIHPLSHFQRGGEGGSMRYDDGDLAVLLEDGRGWKCFGDSYKLHAGEGECMHVQEGVGERARGREGGVARLLELSAVPARR